MLMYVWGGEKRRGETRERNNEKEKERGRGDQVTILNLNVPFYATPMLDCITGNDATEQVHLYINVHKRRGHEIPKLLFYLLHLRNTVAKPSMSSHRHCG